MNSVHAPYNFVPFSELVILPYRNADELPKHDVIDSRSERGELKTGEIHVTITAQTPILAAVQKKKEGHDKQTETHAYARHNGKTYILPGSTIRGMTRQNMHILGFGAIRPNDDIGNVQIAGHYLCEGLPARHQELAKLKLPLDYPKAILGYVSPDGCFRSRVSFEDFQCCNENKKLPRGLPSIKAVLGQPRPSWYPGYVSDGKNYAESGFRLRGYKQYWMKETEQNVRSGKTSVATFMHPLPAGTCFHGVIRYKNLYEDELGLLLWSLCLRRGKSDDKDCYQSIGMGKPYGFGRVKLDIDELWEFDIPSLYDFDGLNGNIYKFGKLQSKRNGQAEHPVNTAVDGYINFYQNYALSKLKGQTVTFSLGEESDYQSLLDFPEIKDFFFIHQVQEQVNSSYMSREQYQKSRDPLPSTATIRDEQESKKPCHFQADESIDSMLMAFQKKMNSKRL